MTELSAKDQITINELVEKFREDQTEVLTKNATAAHIAGDTQAHKALRLKLQMDLINEEAVKFAKAYKKELLQGGCTIQGQFIPWLDKRTKDDREKIAGIIQQGYLQGKPTGVKQMAIGGKYGVYPKGTVAGDLQEYFNLRRSHAATVARTEVARIQSQGSMTRYKKQQVKKVMWLTFEPCPVCEQFNRRIFEINDLPMEVPAHPNCRCALAPVPDARPTGPAPTEPVPPGFEEPMPPKTPDKPGQPARIQHDQIAAKHVNTHEDWTTPQDLRKAGKITDNQVDSIEEYTKGYYEDFNGWLRGQETTRDPDRILGFKRQRDDLDALLKANPMQSDAVLFRSCGRGTAEGLMKNKSYISNSYQSTSVNLGEAELYGERGADGFLNILVTKRSKGDQGFYIFPDANEILLPRGTRYDLLQVREVEKTAYTGGWRNGDQEYNKIRYLIVEAITP